MRLPALFVLAASACACAGASYTQLYDGPPREASQVARLAGTWRPLWVSEIDGRPVSGGAWTLLGGTHRLEVVFADGAQKSRCEVGFSAVAGADHVIRRAVSRGEGRCGVGIYTTAARGSLVEECSCSLEPTASGASRQDAPTPWVDQVGLPHGVLPNR